MPTFKTSGFRSLSVSNDGMAIEIGFSIPGDEDLVILIPAPAWPIIAPYFEQASAEAARLREGDGSGPRPEAAT